MDIIESPSPHFSTRQSEVDTIVVHYISAVNLAPEDPFNLEKILDLLRKPIEYKTQDGQPKSVKVSAHYVVTREGDVHRLVNEENVAWHAGRSNLRQRHVNGSCNDFSIGIELVGGKNFDYPDAEYTGLIGLVKDIRTRHTIPPQNIIGHDFIAPDRKKDPGPHFDWNRLFEGAYGAA
ncbi:N-acetylmuramoyl-L-alanine amidase [candidate division KSB1 bacterium]|nr:N-acetylmuramoyl-L-alanine amidase [candidate division KSB1 bacterium]